MIIKRRIAFAVYSISRGVSLLTGQLAVTPHHDFVNQPTPSLMAHLKRHLLPLSRMLATMQAERWQRRCRTTAQ